MEQLPGSHLLAALHSRMERMQTVVRVQKAAAKKPHSRTSADINCIAAETSNVKLFTREGAAVHRDMCHVLQAVSLSQMQSLRLPGEHKTGIMAFVVAGRVQVRTKSTAAFDHGQDAQGSNSGGSSNDGSSGSKAACNQDEHTEGANPAAASEADLKALFDSIDKDGSGAIDVDELQYALSVMGIEKTPTEVQELMDSVDKDGSGQLEFEEFVLILTTKLGVGGGPLESSWQETQDGSWCKEVQQGGTLGEAALLKGLAQEGMILAVEDSSLLILDASTYNSIITLGFDGQLNAKIAILKNCSALATSISSRSDLRGLAYAAVTESFGWGGQMYVAGQAAGAVYIMQEGCCRIVMKIREKASSPPASAGAAVARQTVTTEVTSLAGDPAQLARSTQSRGGDSAAAAAALLSSPAYGLHSPRSRVVERCADVAVLGPGDLAGEAAVLGSPCHASSAVVSSAHVVVLRLDKQDLKQLLHPADMQRLAKLLQLREDERQQRLAAAANTSSAVLVQQQHVKAAAVVSQAIEAISETRSNSQPTEVSQARIDDAAIASRAVGRRPVCGAAACSTDQSCVSPRLGHSIERLKGCAVLPSSAADAAVAIAAAGGQIRKELQSKVEQRKAKAVLKLLQNLSASTQEIEDAQTLAVTTAVAALAAAQVHAASAAGLAYSSAGVSKGCSKYRCITHSLSGTTDRTTSSPATARYCSTTAGVTQAADLLMPPNLRLVEQPSCQVTPSRCCRCYQHSGTGDVGSSGVQVAVGVVARDGSVSSRSNCICASVADETSSSASSRTGFVTALRATCPASVMDRCLQGSINSKAGNKLSCNCCCQSSSTCNHEGVQHECEDDVQQQQSRRQPNSSRLRCRGCGAEYSRSSALCSPQSTARSFVMDESKVNGSSSSGGGGVGDGQQAGAVHTLPTGCDSYVHTIDGRGAVQPQQQASCNSSLCSEGNENTPQHPAKAAAADVQVCNASSGISTRSGSSRTSIGTDPVVAVHSSNKGHPQASAPCAVKASSPRHSGFKATSRMASSPRLQPLFPHSTAQDMEGTGSNMQVQGSVAPAVSVGQTQPAVTVQRADDVDEQAVSSPAMLMPDSNQGCIASPPGRQLNPAHGPSINGFFLTETTAGQREPPAAVSEAAASAVSAAIAAAEGMRATNSINLCLHKTHTPKGKSQTSPGRKSSVAVIPLELAASACNSTAGAARKSGMIQCQGSSNAATAAIAARARPSNAAAALQSLARSVQARVTLHSSPQLQLQTPSACGLASAPGFSMVCLTDGGKYMHTTATSAGTVSQGSNNTPRSSRTGGSGAAKQVPVRLFSAVDKLVWQVSESAAGCTSWSLGVRLLQSSRPDTKPGNKLSCNAPGVQCGTSIAAKGGSTSCKSISTDDARQSLPERNCSLQQQPQHISRHSAPGALRASVPRLPLHKLQKLLSDGDNRAAPGGSEEAPNDAASASGAATSTPIAGIAPSSGGGGKPSAAALTSPSAQLPLLSTGHRIGSAQQVPLRPSLVQQQDLHLPFDATAAETTNTAVAPLPQWRSALTTRWRPGGRFSQQGGVSTDGSQKKEIRPAGCKVRH